MKNIIQIILILAIGCVGESATQSVYKGTTPTEKYKFAPISLSPASEGDKGISAEIALVQTSPVERDLIQLARNSGSDGFRHYDHLSFDFSCVVNTGVSSNGRFVFAVMNSTEGVGKDPDDVVDPQTPSELVIWELPSDGNIRLTRRKLHGTPQPLFSPDGLLLAGVLNGAVTIWASDTGEELGSYDLDAKNVSFIDDRVLHVSGQRQMQLNLSTGLGTYSNNGDGGVSTSGLSVSSLSPLRISDNQDGREFRTIELPVLPYEHLETYRLQTAALAAAISPDEQHLSAVLYPTNNPRPSWTPNVRIATWRIGDGEEQVTYEDPESRASSMSISAKNYLLALGREASVDLIDLYTGIPLLSLRVPKDNRPEIAEVAKRLPSQSEVISYLQNRTAGRRPAVNDRVSTLRLIDQQVRAQSVELTFESQQTDATIVRIFADGVYVPFVKQSTTNQRHFVATVAMPAEKASFEVEAWAVDRTGRCGRSTETTIRRKSKGETSDAGRLFVVTLGISEYRDGQHNLKYCHRDAQAIDQHFAAQGGNKTIVRRCLVNESATRDSIRRELDWFERAPTRNDVAIVFCSGHGVTGHRGLYFLPHDVNLSSIQPTAVGWDEFASSLKACRAGKILLIADCCNAGAFGIAKTPQATKLAEAFRNDDRIVVMASSQAGQTSIELDEYQHGALTYCLLKALSNPRTDRNSDGKISVLELARETKMETIRITQGRQEPQTIGSVETQATFYVSEIEPE